MAVLSDNARIAVWADAMRQISNDREACSIVKADLRAAVDAIDDWVVANATAFNNTLPTAAKNGLTTAQKSRLFMLVVARRYLDGA